MTGPRSTYRELAPPPDLRSVVACLWEQRIAPGIAAPYDQPVFPDGCIDLVLAGDSLAVAGPATGPVVAPLQPGSVVTGMRFRTGAAPAALGVAASELRDQSVRVDELWGRDGDRLVERTAGSDPATVLAELTAEVRRRLDDVHSVDTMAVAAASALGAAGTGRLAAMAASAGLSDRQFRRRIEDAVGYSPRLLAKVLRFQRFLARARAAPNGQRDLASIAAECGYADQAHLTRDCRELAGLPPARLLAAEAARVAA